VQPGFCFREIPEPLIVTDRLSPAKHAFCGCLNSIILSRFCGGSGSVLTNRRFRSADELSAVRLRRTRNLCHPASRKRPSVVGCIWIGHSQTENRGSRPLQGGHRYRIIPVREYWVSLRSASILLAFLLFMARQPTTVRPTASATDQV
jgi:hypothetical protein